MSLNLRKQFAAVKFRTIQDQEAPENVQRPTQDQLTALRAAIFMRIDSARHILIFGAIVTAAFLTAAHALCIPAGLTYDGFVYVRLADVLFSPRFPAEWHMARTPLYPLALKLSFWLMGRQGASIVAVSLAAGVVGMLAVADTIRRLAGPGPAAMVLLVLSCWPVLVSYEHYGLSETGTFCFLALATWLIALRPRPEAAWGRALALAAILAVGYYWRPSLLAMVSAAAIAHLLSYFPHGRQRTLLSSQTVGSRRRSSVLQALTVLTLPMLAAHFWSGYINQRGVNVMVLRQGIVRQTLFPPDDPFIGHYRAEYVEAIQSVKQSGTMYAGLRERDVAVLSKLLSKDPRQENAQHLFARGVRQYPSRYVLAVLRTWALYLGATGAQNENRIFRDQLLHEDPLFPRGGSEHTSEQAAIWEDMKEPVRDSFIMRMYRTLSKPFDTITVITSVLFFVAYVQVLVERRFRMLAAMTFPCLFLAVSSIVMASIDRYGFPAQPWVMAFGFIAPVLICRSVHSRLFRRSDENGVNGRNSMEPRPRLHQIGIS